MEIDSLEYATVADFKTNQICQLRTPQYCEGEI